jgi:DNA polymerase V
MGDILSRLEKQALIQGVADGYLNTDLNARFISNKAATYLPLAPDDGIEGIAVGDTLIVDRSLKPKPGRVILAEIDGQYCLRRLVRNGTALLLVDDKGYAPPRHVTESDYYHGTVTHNIHSQSW